MGIGSLDATSGAIVVVIEDLFRSLPAPLLFVVDGGQLSHQREVRPVGRGCVVGPIVDNRGHGKSSLHPLSIDEVDVHASQGRGG